MWKNLKQGRCLKDSRQSSSVFGEVTGHLPHESFHPGCLAPYSRARNIIFEAWLFWLWLKERGI